jgi:hypothetical protein
MQRQTVSSINVTGEIGYLRQKNSIDHCFILSIKINSKWTNNLNIRPETLKTKIKHMRKVHNFVFAMTFWICPKTQAMKVKVNKWNYIKLERFCS